MSEYQQRAEQIVRRLEGRTELLPAEELETFRSVLDDLTAMMNEQDTLPGTGSSS
ncbi:MAG: hypothetical protein ACTHZ5_13410 [Micrococcaceae bacterium]